LSSSNDVCGLLEALLGGGLSNDFAVGLRRFCRALAGVCGLDNAFRTLLGEDGLRLGDAPPDLREALSRVLSGVPVPATVEWVLRTLYGLKPSEDSGFRVDHTVGVGIRDSIDYVVVRKQGGIAGWVCGPLARAVEGSLGATCLPERGLGSADALRIVSEYVAESSGRRLFKLLTRVSSNVATLLPGVSPYATLAWVLRFTPLPVLRSALSGCGLRGRLADVLKELSLAVFDLSSCTLYRSVDSVPPKLLKRGECVVTAYKVIVKRESFEGGAYKVFGEEVATSPTYALLDYLTSGWLRAEEILFGKSPAASILEKYVAGSLNGQPPPSRRAGEAIRAALEAGVLKITTVPGKDEFSDNDISLALELSRAVQSGVLEVSVGWDGVVRGNALINRYALIFRPSYIVKSSETLRKNVLRWVEGRL